MSSRGEIATKAIVLLVIHLVIATVIILFIAKGIYSIFDKPDNASDRHELERFVRLIDNFAKSDAQMTKTFLVMQPNIFMVSFHGSPWRIVHERDPNFNGGVFESNAIGWSLCSFKNPNNGGGLETIDCHPIEGYRLLGTEKPVFGMKVASSGAGVYPLTIAATQGNMPFFATPATGVGGVFEAGDIYKSVSYYVKLEKRQTGSAPDIFATLSR